MHQWSHTQSKNQQHHQLDEQQGFHPPVIWHCCHAVGNCSSIKPTGRIAQQIAVFEKTVLFCFTSLFVGFEFSTWMQLFRQH